VVLLAIVDVAAIAAVPNNFRLLVFHQLPASGATSVDLSQEEEAVFLAVGEEGGHPCSRHSSCLDPFHLAVVLAVLMVLLVDTFP